MEGLLLGVLLGVGSMFAVAKRKREARAAIAWSARQAGWISGKVQTALTDASKTARDEYQRARLEQIERDPLPEIESDKRLQGSPPSSPN